MLHGSEQLFASRYKLILPSEEELRSELAREAEAIRAVMRLDEKKTLLAILNRFKRGARDRNRTGTTVSGSGDFKSPVSTNFTTRAPRRYST